MSYLIPEGTIAHSFMTDRNGFISEAEIVLGDDTLFEDNDRILLLDLV
jgi:hypothetical protein